MKPDFLTPINAGYVIACADVNDNYGVAAVLVGSDIRVHKVTRTELSAEYRTIPNPVIYQPLYGFAVLSDGNILFMCAGGTFDDYDYTYNMGLAVYALSPSLALITSETFVIPRVEFVNDANSTDFQVLVDGDQVHGFFMDKGVFYA